jgi:hypothetical protein
VCNGYGMLIHWSRYWLGHTHTVLARAWRSHKQKFHASHMLTILYLRLIGQEPILRHGTASARFLGMRVRIPPGHECPLAIVECCQVEVSTMRRSLVQGIRKSVVCLNVITNAQQ